MYKIHSFFVYRKQKKKWEIDERYLNVSSPNIYRYCKT